MPLMDALKNVMLNEEVDIKVINYLKSFAKAIGFTDTLFVSSAGDNSDGGSWEKAYTSITTALDWVASNQSSGETHLIIIGVGTFDVNTTGDPTYDENIVIMGSGRYKTIIQNSHASATSVLKLTGVSGLFNCTIYTGTGSSSGILLNASGANGFEMENVLFNSYSASGAMDCILIDGTIGYVNVNNCQFDCDTTNTKAIHLNGCSEGKFENIIINEALLGIHLDHANDDDNFFRNITLNDSITGITIDGGDENYFINTIFNGCTTNVSDSGTNNRFIKVILDSEVQTITPSNLTGQTITAGVGANTYSAATQIYAAASATKPFKILGIIVENAAAEKYGIKLSSDAGTSYFWEGIIETTANAAKVLYFKESYIISQGTAIHGAVKSETGGNNSIIWLMIATI